MQLETVCRVSVRNLSLEVCGQVDNVNGTKRAFLWTDTTTNTQTLRNVGNLGLGRNFYAKFASSDDRAGFLAFLTAFLFGSEWFLCLVSIAHTFGLHCGAEN